MNRIFWLIYLYALILSLTLLLFRIVNETPCPTTESPISVQPGPSSTNHRHVL